jgi:hypothetical protein
MVVSRSSCPIACITAVGVFGFIHRHGAERVARAIEFQVAWQRQILGDLAELLLEAAQLDVSRWRLRGREHPPRFALSAPRPQQSQDALTQRHTPASPLGLAVLVEVEIASPVDALDLHADHFAVPHATVEHEREHVPQWRSWPFVAAPIDGRKLDRLQQPALVFFLTEHNPPLMAGEGRQKVRCRIALSGDAPIARGPSVPMRRAQNHRGAEKPAAL